MKNFELINDNDLSPEEVMSQSKSYSTDDVSNSNILDEDRATGKVIIAGNGSNSNLLKKGVSQKEVEKSLLQAIEGEMTIQKNYEHIISIAPTTEAKKILTKIKQDHKDHQKIYEQMYKQLTGKNANVTPVPVKFTDAYKPSVREAMYDEIDVVEFYTTIHNMYYEMDSKDNIYEIINDEHDHSTLDSYLFNKA